MSVNKKMNGKIIVKKGLCVTNTMILWQNAFYKKNIKAPGFKSFKS